MINLLLNFIDRTSIIRDKFQPISTEAMCIGPNYATGIPIKVIEVPSKIIFT